MDETIVIKKSAAQQAHKIADKETKEMLEILLGKENLVPKNITERIKTFEDACEFLNRDPEKVFAYTDTLDVVAYKKLKVIIEALNEGWQPNWNDSSEYKYWPWMDASGSRLSYYDYGCGNSRTVVGSRLCFKTRALAEYAGKQFTDIYSDFFLIK